MQVRADICKYCGPGFGAQFSVEEQEERMFCLCWLAVKVGDWQLEIRKIGEPSQKVCVARFKLIFLVPLFHTFERLCSPFHPFLHHADDCGWAGNGSCSTGGSRHENSKQTLPHRFELRCVPTVLTQRLPGIAAVAI